MPSVTLLFTINSFQAKLISVIHKSCVIHIEYFNLCFTKFNLNHYLKIY